MASTEKRKRRKLKCHTKKIESFMTGLLAKLPEDEQAKVDPQIYYDTDRLTKLREGVDDLAK